ncbi:hypothetical protein C0995_010722 [Termitomyces sp. Mi166|nr:hypothetical protein C0995_010722 [Termitomyces sp. Mi166\
MAHQISSEIYSMIVRNLHPEVSTLGRVSLVNKAFALHSRPYLWRRVTITSGTTSNPTSIHVSSCANFYSEILTGGVLTPAVGDLVQEFCIDNTEIPSALSSDVYLPLVLNCFTGLTKFEIFEISWPIDNDNPLITSISNILRSASLKSVTIQSSAIPTYLIDDCQAVRTLRLQGSYLLELPMVEDVPAVTRPPRLQHLILDVGTDVAVDVWSRVDTSHLQSLIIQLPGLEEDALLNGRALQYLGLNYMEDATEYDHPAFDTLVNLKQLLIVFPTWLAAWPQRLATLLEFLDPLMQNLEQVHLCLIVEPADTLVNKKDRKLHRSRDFQVLDHRLAHLRSPRLVNVRVALCPNGTRDGEVINISGRERIIGELPNTYARGILSVDVVARKYWLEAVAYIQS